MEYISLLKNRRSAMEDTSKSPDVSDKDRQ
jgi:hypothetical protein